LLEGDLHKFNVKDIRITDFCNNLPKENFTLEEWVEFVENNPHYLTINSPPEAINDDDSLKNVCLSVFSAFENIESYTTPLQILQQRLSRSEFVKKQKSEYEEIYTKCIASDDFTFENEEKVYKLVSDLLMIKIKDDIFKIFVPPSMIGLLLAHTHLLGHTGVTKMLKNMDSYYFETMYTVTKNFVQSCYSCFLSYTGTKKQKLGIYPIPSRPFEEIMIDFLKILMQFGDILIFLWYFALFLALYYFFPLNLKQMQKFQKFFYIQFFNHSTLKNFTRTMVQDFVHCHF
jgi:hypothetical protein